MIGTPLPADRDDVARLRDALATWAKSDRLVGANPGSLHECFNETECRGVLAAAGVEIPESRLSAVAVVFKRLPFYGGNYTLDAKRMLRASREDARR